MLAFGAESLWGCDGSHAIKGEELLIFLTKHIPRKSSQWTIIEKKLRAEFGKSMKLFGISSAGRGRMIITKKDTKRYLKFYGVKFPKRLRVKSLGNYWQASFEDFSKIVKGHLAKKRRTNSHKKQ